MMSEDLPQPEPRDALVPPSRRPPTAVGADTPEPPRPPQRSHEADVEHRWRMKPELRKLVNTVLDAVDRVAEKIAVELGVRERGGGSSSANPPAA